MKKNYNFNKDPKNLSDADISKHMDFDSVLKNAGAKADPGIPKNKRRPKMRWLKAVAGAAAAILAGALLFFGGIGKKDKVNVQNEVVIETPYVDPPFKNIKPVFASRKFKNSKGGVYEFESGSKVIVPDNAFVHKDGKPVKGKVDIKFREFHDYVDFFMSGIPMEYDSNGTKYILESAGMIEIYGEKDGERVEIAPDKSIAVELISNIEIPNVNVKPNFNIYRLDTEKRNWDYRGVDNIEFVKPKARLDTTITAIFDENGSVVGNQMTIVNVQTGEVTFNNNSIKQIELAKIEASIPKPAAPIKPVKENGSDLVFDFDFETAKITGRANQYEEEALVNQAQNELIEMKEKYGEVLWQVSPRQGAFDEKKMEKRFADVAIKKINNIDFEITLSNPAEQVTFLANPVLSGENYEQAMQEFSAEFAKYEQEVAARESQLATLRGDLNARLNAEKAAAEKSYEEAIAIYKKNGRDDLVSGEMIKQKVINRFEVSSFGVWNCDRPLPYYMSRVKGDFVDKKNKFFNNKPAFMVDKSRNTVSKFYTKKDKDVVYNKDSDNIMWLVTKENKLAVYRPEKFKNLEREGQGKVQFVLDVVDEVIEDEDDVRRILQF